MHKTVFYFIPGSMFIFFLAMNTGHALNKEIVDVHNNQKKIDLIYYDRFPYKKSYDGIKIPECIRVPARQRQKTSDVLLCKEHIALLRPASVIKLWQRQQRLKGYIPFSMKEFGIINVHAYITGVKEYTQVMKNNIAPDSTHVTGKFIRYAPEVNHYIIKDKQTNMTSAVDATPNHPFYVINKHAFVPISKVLSSDSLVTLSNHEAHLTYPDGSNYLYSINRKKNKLIRVYNVEAEKKHVYFISKLNILVHNPYTDYEKDKKIKSRLYSLLEKWLNPAVPKDKTMPVWKSHEPARKLYKPVLIKDYEEKILPSLGNKIPCQIMEVSSTGEDNMFIEKIEAIIMDHDEEDFEVDLLQSFTAEGMVRTLLRERSRLEREIADGKQLPQRIRANAIHELYKK